MTINGLYSYNILVTNYKKIKGGDWMLQYYDILSNVNGLLYEVLDKDNNIYYPKTKKEVVQIENIIANNPGNSTIYDEESKKWYQYCIKSLTKDNKEYTIKYLLDVTEFKTAEENYKTDSLTKVLSRPTILEKIGEELFNCYQNNIPFSLVMCDIDFFKQVNDSYGHIAGDEVLRNLGGILLNNTQNDSEMVGRYGGEEFILFFRDINLKQTMDKITEIKNALDKLVIEYEDKSISNITMSFGIYHINNLKNEGLKINTKEELITQLIAGADMALYKSKDGGRNQTHVYSDAGFIEKCDYK